MKEKDIERLIDDMITEGLIKECEQDNADFEAGLRNMSDEDFIAMISDARPEYESAMQGHPEEAVVSPELCFSICADEHMGATDLEEEIEFAKSNMRAERKSSDQNRRKPWRVWLAAALSAAAVLAIVLIPAYRSMDSRLCESALVACEAYMPPSRGGVDISKAATDELRADLPELESEFNEAINRTGGLEYYYAVSPAEAGWNLATVYLRLGERRKAKEVLAKLAEMYADNEFGQQCLKIAEIL